VDGPKRAGVPHSGDYLSVGEICAILVAEPYNVPPSELRDVTVTQFYKVYCHPRDEKGNLDRAPRGAAETPADPRAVFFRMCRLRRLRDDQIEVLWRAELERLERERERERREKDEG
jgi:hypothetical protein